MDMYNQINKFDDLLKTIQISYEQKVIIAKKLIDKLLIIIDEAKYSNFFISKNTILDWYFTVFSISNNKNIEYQFYNDVLDKKVDYDWFSKECLDNYNPKMIDLLRKFILGLSNDNKEYFWLFAVLIYSLNDNPTNDDKLYLINFFMEQ